MSSSCTAKKSKYPNLPSGFYVINPAEGNAEFRIKAYCDMTSKEGTGVTVIGHDSEQRTRVSGYESPGSYRKKIAYKRNMTAIAALTKISKHCEQFIKYQCVHSFIYKHGTYYAWWVSRQGAKMKYWGGAGVHSGSCACQMTNSWAGGYDCNCDANDDPMREDSGFLTDKTTLPVTELRFGDTGNSIEYGYHTLGKLKCWG